MDDMEAVEEEVIVRETAVVVGILALIDSSLNSSSIPLNSFFKERNKNWKKTFKF